MGKYLEELEKKAAEKSGENTLVRVMPSGELAKKLGKTGADRAGEMAQRSDNQARSERAARNYYDSMAAELSNREKRRRNLEAYRMLIADGNPADPKGFFDPNMSDDYLADHIGELRLLYKPEYGLGDLLASMEENGELTDEEREGAEKMLADYESRQGLHEKRYEEIRNRAELLVNPLYSVIGTTLPGEAVREALLSDRTGAPEVQEALRAENEGLRMRQEAGRDRLRGDYPNPTGLIMPSGEELRKDFSNALRPGETLYIRKDDKRWVKYSGAENGEIRAEDETDRNSGELNYLFMSEQGERGVRGSVNNMNILAQYTGSGSPLSVLNPETHEPTGEEIRGERALKAALFLRKNIAVANDAGMVFAGFMDEHGLNLPMRRGEEIRKRREAAWQRRLADAGIPGQGEELPERFLLMAEKAFDSGSLLQNEITSEVTRMQVLLDENTKAYNTSDNYRNVQAALANYASQHSTLDPVSRVEMLKNVADLARTYRDGKGNDPNANDYTRARIRAMEEVSRITGEMITSLQAIRVLGYPKNEKTERLASITDKQIDARLKTAISAVNGSTFDPESYAYMRALIEFRNRPATRPEDLMRRAAEIAAAPEVVFMGKALQGKRVDAKQLEACRRAAVEVVSFGNRMAGVRSAEKALSYQAIRSNQLGSLGSGHADFDRAVERELSARLREDLELENYRFRENGELIDPPSDGVSYDDRQTILRALSEDSLESERRKAQELSERSYQSDLDLARSVMGLSKREMIRLLSEVDNNIGERGRAEYTLASYLLANGLTFEEIMNPEAKPERKKELGDMLKAKIAASQEAIRNDASGDDPTAVKKREMHSLRAELFRDCLLATDAMAEYQKTCLEALDPADPQSVRDYGYRFRTLRSGYYDLVGQVLTGETIFNELKDAFKKEPNESDEVTRKWVTDINNRLMESQLGAFVKEGGIDAKADLVRYFANQGDQRTRSFREEDIRQTVSRYWSQTELAPVFNSIELPGETYARETALRSCHALRPVIQNSGMAAILNEIPAKYAAFLMTPEMKGRITPIINPKAMMGDPSAAGADLISGGSDYIAFRLRFNDNSFHDLSGGIVIGQPTEEDRAALDRFARELGAFAKEKMRTAENARQREYNEKCRHFEESLAIAGGEHPITASMARLFRESPAVVREMETLIRTEEQESMDHRPAADPLESIVVGDRTLRELTEATLSADRLTEADLSEDSLRMLEAGILAAALQKNVAVTRGMQDGAGAMYLGVPAKKIDIEKPEDLKQPEPALSGQLENIWNLLPESGVIAERGGRQSAGHREAVEKMEKMIRTEINKAYFDTERQAVDKFPIAIEKIDHLMEKYDAFSREIGEWEDLTAFRFSDGKTLTAEAAILTLAYAKGAKENADGNVLLGTETFGWEDLTDGRVRGAIDDAKAEYKRIQALPEGPLRDAAMRAAIVSGVREMNRLELGKDAPRTLEKVNELGEYADTNLIRLQAQGEILTLLKEDRELAATLGNEPAITAGDLSAIRYLSLASGLDSLRNGADPLPQYEALLSGMSGLVSQMQIKNDGTERLTLNSATEVMNRAGAIGKQVSSVYRADPRLTGIEAVMGGFLDNLNRIRDNGPAEYRRAAALLRESANWQPDREPFKGSALNRLSTLAGGRSMPSAEKAVPFLQLRELKDSLSASGADQAELNGKQIDRMILSRKAAMNYISSVRNDPKPGRPTVESRRKEFNDFKTLISRATVDRPEGLYDPNVTDEYLADHIGEMDRAFRPAGRGLTALLREMNANHELTEADLQDLPWMSAGIGPCEERYQNLRARADILVNPIYQYIGTTAPGEELRKRLSEAGAKSTDLQAMNSTLRALYGPVEPGISLETFRGMAPEGVGNPQTFGAIRDAAATGDREYRDAISGQVRELSILLDQRTALFRSSDQYRNVQTALREYLAQSDTLDSGSRVEMLKNIAGLAQIYRDGKTREGASEYTRNRIDAMDRVIREVKDLAATAGLVEGAGYPKDADPANRPAITRKQLDARRNAFAGNVPRPFDAERYAYVRALTELRTKASVRPGEIAEKTASILRSPEVAFMKKHLTGKVLTGKQEEVCGKAARNMAEIRQKVRRSGVEDLVSEYEDLRKATPGDLASGLPEFDEIIREETLQSMRNVLEIKNCTFREDGTVNPRNPEGLSFADRKDLLKALEDQTPKALEEVADHSDRYRQDALDKLTRSVFGINSIAADDLFERVDPSLSGRARGPFTLVSQLVMSGLTPDEILDPNAKLAEKKAFGDSLKADIEAAEGKLPKGLTGAAEREARAKAMDGIRRRLYRNNMDATPALIQYREQKINAWNPESAMEVKALSETLQVYNDGLWDMICQRQRQSDTWTRSREESLATYAKPGETEEETIQRVEGIFAMAERSQVTSTQKMNLISRKNQILETLSLPDRADNYAAGYSDASLTGPVGALWVDKKLTSMFAALEDVKDPQESSLLTHKGKTLTGIIKTELDDLFNRNFSSAEGVLLAMDPALSDKITVDFNEELYRKMSEEDAATDFYEGESLAVKLRLNYNDGTSYVLSPNGMRRKPTEEDLAALYKFRQEIKTYTDEKLADARMGRAMELSGDRTFVRGNCMEQSDELRNVSAAMRVSEEAPEAFSEYASLLQSHERTAEKYGLSGDPYEKIAVGNTTLDRLVDDMLLGDQVRNPAPETRRFVAAGILTAAAKKGVPVTACRKMMSGLSALQGEPYIVPMNPPAELKGIAGEKAAVVDALWDRLPGHDALLKSTGQSHKDQVNHLADEIKKEMNRDFFDKDPSILSGMPISPEKGAEIRAKGEAFTEALLPVGEKLPDFTFAKHGSEPAMALSAETAIVTLAYAKAFSGRGGGSLLQANDRLSAEALGDPRIRAALNDAKEQYKKILEMPKEDAERSLRTSVMKGLRFLHDGKAGENCPKSDDSLSAVGRYAEENQVRLRTEENLMKFVLKDRVPVDPKAVPNGTLLKLMANDPVITSGDLTAIQFLNLSDTVLDVRNGDFGDGNAEKIGRDISRLTALRGAYPEAAKRVTLKETTEIAATTENLGNRIRTDNVPPLREGRKAMDLLRMGNAIRSMVKNEKTVFARAEEKAEEERQASGIVRKAAEPEAVRVDIH